jgi:capsular exopolysaccharide synthesis family protein
MSELFGWLKQRDGQRVKKVAGIRTPRYEIRPIAPRNESETLPLEVSETTGAVVPRAEIRSTIQFDLNAADFRVRTVLDPLTIVGEQFRRLRTSLSLMQKQRGIKSVLVTSACPDEGKTLTACGLAGVLAQEPGRRVLLIDADLRKPRAGRQIGVKGNPGTAAGLSEILQGEADLMDSIAGSLDSNLFFLPAGRIPPNPSELLTSPVLETALKSSTEVFDWVVIDTPPILALSDPAVMGPLCDAILLVVRAGVTPSKLVREAAQRLGREKICGIVINRIRHLESAYYYRYYHGKSSG